VATVCDHSKTQKQSPGDYVTPDQIRQDQQPQYAVIQLDQTQHGPADDCQYDTVNTETRHQYDAMANNNPRPVSDDYLTPIQTSHAQQPQYDDIQLGHGPAADQYDTLNPETLGEQHQYEAISRREAERSASDYLEPMDYTYLTPVF